LLTTSGRGVLAPWKAFGTRAVVPALLSMTLIASATAAVTRPAMATPSAPSPAAPTCPSGADVWTGGAGDGQWSTAGNWSSGVPTSSSYACVLLSGASVTLSSGSEQVSGLLTGPGTSLTVSGQGTILTLGGSSTPSASQGDLSVASGAAIVVASGATLLNSSGSTITINAGGQLVVAGTFEQGDGTVATGQGDTPVYMTNRSVLDLAGTGPGAFEVFEPYRALPTGLNGAPPTVILEGEVASGQSITLASDSNGGYCPATLVAAGSLTNAGTITTASVGPGCNGPDAVIEVPSGSTFTNAGTISLHSDTAADLEGNFKETSSGTISADMVGAPGSDRPMLSVSGSAELDGALDFETSTVPTSLVGDTYSLLSAADVTGSFARFSGLSAGGDVAYDPYTTANGYSFGVVSLSSFPWVTALDPYSGPAGTQVVVYGSDLTGATEVDFGSAPASSISVVSPTELIATAPAGTGQVPVTVTTPNGTTSSLVAPDFTYASTPTSPAGSASLTINVTSPAGDPLAGVVVGVADATTRDPLGFLTTGPTGTASLSGLSTGQSVAVTVLSEYFPYGPAEQDYTLAAGVNDETLSLPLEPLVSSDPTMVAPDGAPLAVWPEVLPAPGTTIPGGPLASPADLAKVDLTVSYNPTQTYALSSDPATAKGFCVDGSWDLTLVGPAPSTSSQSATGGGCPPGGPVNLAQLFPGLTAGTYGAQLTLSAPAGASTAGTTDIYLTAPAGTITQLVPDPASVLHAPAQLYGHLNLDVGHSGELSVLLGGTPLPGVTGVHTQYSFDPTGIDVTGWSPPAPPGSWYAAGHLETGGGGFQETTSTSPLSVGSTVVSLDVTCLQAGTWPVTFAGDYWEPGVSGNYAADGISSPDPPTVTCNPPPAAAAVSPSEVAIDQATGDVIVSLTGSGLSGAASATLSGDNGASSPALSLRPSSSGTGSGAALTIVFPPTPPGLYDIKVTDGSGATLYASSGFPLEVEPALPLFSFGPASSLPYVPNLPTTQTWRLSNEGTVDGVAVMLFTFPAYMGSEPTVTSAPAGTTLLLHGKTAAGWAEYLAVPVSAGSTVDLSITGVLPFDALQGGLVHLGDPVPVVPTLAGEFTSAEWASVSQEPPSAVLAAAVGDGFGDYTAALKSLISEPPDLLTKYMANLTDADLGEALQLASQAVMEDAAMQLV